MLSSGMGPGKWLHLASVKALKVMLHNISIQFPFNLFKTELQKPFVHFWLLPMFNPSPVTSPLLRQV